MQENCAFVILKNCPAQGKRCFSEVGFDAAENFKKLRYNIEKKLAKNETNFAEI